MKRFMRIFDWWAFLWSQELWWFQRVPPLFEFDTRIYVGRPGTGKTLFATRDGIDLMRRGVRVISNYVIRDPKTGQQSLPIESWVDLLRWAVKAMEDQTPTVFIIDEINLWAPSRFYKQTPAWWLTLMAQRRHFGIGIIATAQSFGRVEIVLRELVNTIVFLHSWPIPVPILHLGRNVSLKVHRLPIFWANAMDPEDAEVATAVQTDSKGAAAKQRMSLGKPVWMRGEVYGGYSTAELMAVEEWSEDADVNAMVADLLSFARDHVAVDYIPSMSDPWLDVLDSLTVCEKCDDRSGCSDRKYVAQGIVCDRVASSCV